MAGHPLDGDTVGIIRKEIEDLVPKVLLLKTRRKCASLKEVLEGVYH